MIVFDESLTSESHIELFFSGLAAVAALLIPIWLNIRDGQKEADQKQQDRHEENIQRFATLEAALNNKVDPMYSWWTGKINGGGNH